MTLFKKSFQLRKLFLKKNKIKLLVVAQTWRFLSDSEPNWPSYLFSQCCLCWKILGCSFGALYTHHCLPCVRGGNSDPLSKQPLHGFPPQRFESTEHLLPAAGKPRGTESTESTQSTVSIVKREPSPTPYQVLSETSPEAPELLQGEPSVRVELCT